MTADPERSNIHRALGKLDARVEAQQKEIASLASAIETSRRESSDGRSRMYNELEQIRMAAVTMSGTVEQLNKSREKDAAKLEKIDIWKERFIGMQMLMAAVWTMIGAGVALLWKWLAVKIGMG